MAKKFGKRGKQGAGGPGEDPRDLFGNPQLPRHAGPPASSTPLGDHLAQGWPGVDQGYVVLPRALAESMSLPWQQQMAGLLAEFHRVHGNLSWPIYRVVPSRYENLVDLDEEQLAEAGYLVEMDAEGEMIYRERSGRKVEDPEATTVLVSSLDPVVRRAPEQQAPPQQPRQAPQAPQQPQAPPPQRQPAQQQPPQPSQPLPQQAPPRRQPEQPRPPAPMNIPPPPVWRSTPQQPPASQQPPRPPTPPSGTPMTPPGGSPPGPVGAQQPATPPPVPASPPPGQQPPPRPPGTPPSGTPAQQAVPPPAAPEPSEMKPAPAPPERTEAVKPPKHEAPPPVREAPHAAPLPERPASASTAPPPMTRPEPPDGEPDASESRKWTAGALLEPKKPEPPSSGTKEPSGLKWWETPESTSELPPPKPPENAEPKRPAAEEPDADTPPRGFRAPAPPQSRDWFDEMPERSSGTGSGFGPTGEPTEIPYRYRK